MSSPNSAKSDANFSIRYLTKAKGTPEGAPFESIKRNVLGDSYNLSVVICGDTLSHRLNKIYRDKDYPTDVLSFPLSKNAGEIFLNLSRSKKLGVGFLFIHGLLHLKGMEHGATMERKEKDLFKKFYGAPHRSGHRYRNISNQSRDRRGNSR